VYLEEANSATVRPRLASRYSHFRGWSYTAA